MIESNYNKQDFRDWYAQNAESYKNRFDRCRAAYVAGFAAAESDVADVLADQCVQPGNEVDTPWDEKDPGTGEVDEVAVFLNAAEDLAIKSECDLSVQLTYSGGEIVGVSVEADNL